MNKTGIEWCDMTFNPITGCYHNCEYCYAMKQSQRFRGHWHEKDGKVLQCHTYSKYSIHKETGYCVIAEADIKHLYGEREMRPATKDPNNKDIFQYFPLFQLDTPLEYLRKDDTIQDAPYPFGFLPTFHRYRLNEPREIKKQQNVFVGSMADMFGQWVPDEWIMEVFKACETAPQHRYLFLTKNPKRYTQPEIHNFGNEGTNKLYHKYPDNWCFGVTVTNIDECYSKLNKLPFFKNCFVSIEPIQDDVADYIMLNGRCYIKWVIIGAETGNRKGKIIPKREWIEYIVDACSAAKIPVFLKNNLAEIWQESLIQEFPWEV